MGIFDPTHNVNYIHTPQAARYGRSPEDGQAGGNAARDEWQQGMGANDADQDAISGGMGYANGQAANAQKRGPQAVENGELANNVAGGANGNQAGAVGLAGTLARGQQPSVAAYSLQNGLNQASAQQSAMAAGGRGSAAIATGSQDARNNTAGLQQNAFTSGQALKAQDMATGRAAYGGLLGTQRDQDNARIGQSNEMGQFNSDLNDKSSLGWGQAGVAFGNVGNAQSGQDQQYYNASMNPVNAQSEADQQYQLWLANAQKQKVAATKDNG